MYKHVHIISKSPLNFVLEEGIKIGTSTTGKTLSLDPERLQRHLLVIGKTGSGKSNFLKVLVEGIISRNEGSILLLDPHGELGKEVASMFPDGTAVISPRVLDEGGVRRSISLNAISIDDTIESNNIATGWIKDAFASEGVFSHGTWGPRLEVIFTSILHELLRSNPEASLSDLLNLLLDPNEMRRFISATKGAEVKAFLKMQVSDWRGWNQYVTSSINKLLPLLTDEGIKRFISGKEDSFNLYDQFNGNSRIVVPELWKDVVPGDSFKIIGMLLVLKLWLQRIRSIDTETTKPIYMIFDEAQLVPPGILDRLLREGRKYGFRIILATQFLGKGFDSLSETIRGNVGNIVSFNLLEKDAVEISSNFFSGEVRQKLENVLKLQTVHNAVIWSHGDDGMSGPLSFKPYVEDLPASSEVFNEILADSLKALGSPVQENQEQQEETDLHEFLIQKFQGYLMRKGIVSDRHRSFQGIFPDLYFEHNNSTVFVEVEVSDLVNIGRVAEKIVNYSGRKLVFITPPGASNSLFARILKYIDSSGLKMMEKAGREGRDLLSDIAILEYTDGFQFLSAGRLRRLRMEHIVDGTFSHTIREMPMAEIRSYIYGLMVKDGVVRMEFPEKKLGETFGSENCEKARKRFCSKSSLVSLHDLFVV